jgi:anaerobic magnesium-protoporphyrin IX monomethyl ester cyclase
MIALVALHAGYSHSSLALQSIAAYAKPEAYFDCIHQYEVLVNSNPQPLLEALVELNPRIIGFSTYLWNITAAIHLCRLLKQLLPQVAVVFGGPEAGPRGKSLLADISSLDYVIQGEGEAAFNDLIKFVLYGEGVLRNISGLIYRDRGKLLSNPVKLLPVDSIPAPILEGMVDTSRPLVYWETARGCPYTCSFCTSATDRLRAYPLERIEADLHYLERLENKTIKLLDRSFHLGEQRSCQLLERFARTPPGLRFHLELNPDRISPRAMAIFENAQAGKFQFEIGLQTLDESVLKVIERRMDITKSLDNIRQLVNMRRHPVHLDLIVGLPGETADQCAVSFDRTFCLYPDHLQLGTLKLLPGTPLRDQAEQLGYRWDPDPPYEVLSHPQLSFGEIARFKRYGVLLERLWNSGYLRTTLSALVEGVFQDSVSGCFDELLQVCGSGLARDNHQPDTLFDYLATFIQSYLSEQPVLAETLLWDYCHFSLVTGKTPPWIASRLEQTVRLIIDDRPRRLPVITLTQAGVDLVQRQSTRILTTGRYAVWPVQHKRGKPVEIVALDQT